MTNYVTVNEARTVLKRADRVLVVGSSGGGKTTLSLEIADTFDLEYLSIDRDVRWLPGWRERERDEQRRLLSGLVGRNRWVMDGSGSSTFDIRVPRADLIIWIRVPRIVALFGVMRRVLKNYGKVRVAMAQGCPEPLPDWDFLSYIWNFERKSAPHFVTQISRFGPDVPLMVVCSRLDCGKLLDPS